ncbi:MAG: MFS transporter [Thermomicrobiales bacterium]
MSGTEIRRFSDDQSLIGGRWIVALLQAVSSSLATGLMLPVVILAAYVAFLTTNMYRVALVPILAFGLWNLGALVAGRITRERVRLLPWAFGGGAARAAAIGAMAYVAYHTNPTDDNRLTTFLICLGGFGFASGFTSVQLDSLLQKSFESSSRAQLFLGRAFWGLIAAVISGVVVRSVFQTDGPETQRAFAYLFMAATGCFASAAFFTLLVKEPVRRLSSARHGAHATVLAGLSDRVMVRYLVFRIALAAVGMLDVFIVIYTMQELGLQRDFLGTYVIAFCAALAIGVPLARSLGSRRGGRAVLQTSTWMKLIAPLLLLTIPYLRDSSDVADRISSDSFYLWVVAVCYVALGMSLAFQGAGNFQYLSEIAPATNRAGYFATANVVLMFTTLLSLVAAWILTEWDFERLFGVTAAVALLAVLLSGILVDNRIVASRPATAARLGRVSFR